MEGPWLTTKQLKDLLSHADEDHRQQGAMLFWTDPTHWFPYFSARQLDGLTIRFREGDTFVVLRAHKPRGQQQVAFVGLEVPALALWAAAHSVAFDLLRWRDDEYAKP